MNILVSATPVISASAIYAAGDCVGGLMTFTFESQQPIGEAVLQNILITDKAKQNAALDLVLFASNPSASTFTDNAACAVHANDITKIGGVFSLTASNYVSFSANSAGMLSNVATPFTVNGKSLYGVLIARGTPTYAATSDIKVSLKLL